MDDRLSRTTRASLHALTAISALGAAAVAVAIDPAIALWEAAALAAIAPIAVGALTEIALRRPLVAAVAAAEAARRHAHDLAADATGLLELDGRLDAALALADNEPEVLDLVGRGLAALLADRDNAVLLAPADGTRVTWTIPADPDGLGEPVALGRAERCTALATGRRVWSASTDDLDACSHARSTMDDPGHGGDPDGHELRSSLCVPFPPVGALHSAGAPGDDVDALRTRLVDSLARRAGERLTTIRAARGNEDHVAVDPLTGLPNHTAAQRAMRDLLAGDRGFAVALCDLDGFSGYNAEEGSERGDRALRLFAEVLGATVRPGDLVARYAGDRFLCVFPDCSATNATAAMDRVRERLVLELTSHDLARFTASAGIGEARPGASVGEVVEDADIALLVAKNEGGNRVRSSRFDQLPSS